MRLNILLGLAPVLVAACSGAPSEPIRDFGAATISAFERDVVTQKELALPPSFDSLPPSILGAPNRADP